MNELKVWGQGGQRVIFVVARSIIDAFWEGGCGGRSNHINLFVVFSDQNGNAPTIQLVKLKYVRNVSHNNTGKLDGTNELETITEKHFSVC